MPSTPTGRRRRARESRRPPRPARTPAGTPRPHPKGIPTPAREGRTKCAMRRVRPSTPGGCSQRAAGTASRIRVGTSWRALFTKTIVGAEDQGPPIRKQQPLVHDAALSVRALPEPARTPSRSARRSPSVKVRAHRTPRPVDGASTGVDATWSSVSAACATDKGTGNGRRSPAEAEPSLADRVAARATSCSTNHPTSPAAKRGSTRPETCGGLFRVARERRQAGQRGGGTTSEPRPSAHAGRTFPHPATRFHGTGDVCAGDTGPASTRGTKSHELSRTRPRERHLWTRTR